jgi:hypothetical protein
MAMKNTVLYRGNVERKSIISLSLSLSLSLSPYSIRYKRELKAIDNYETK